MSDEGFSRGGFLFGGNGNFSSLCPNGTEWVWDGLGECAQDARDMASVILGLLSIVCFMVSSFPQYYKSCKTGNMDSALSIWFLLLWLAGDSCNLIGSFLADQLPLQTYTAVYYVCADLVMLSMYGYYVLRHKMSNGGDRAVLNVAGVLCVFGMSASLLRLPGPHLQTGAVSGFRGRSLLAVDQQISSVQTFTAIQPFSTREIIGFTIGSASSLLYLCSRLPQMYTNFRRKSTEGVSYFLFALVILGNITYGLSVLLKNPEHGQGEGSYIIHHLPWLIGSLGTLTLDLLISVQFLIYRRAPLDSYSRVEETTALLHN
ncbi:lysosomal amino acid transporter 1 homolog [Salminus brasiliensis]|uniref:lysosomal amino acid transporter 1 homolog n=1 Tax=Salminus brasiliensis TaxID=930266 RepID=UPI003B8345C2